MKGLRENLQIFVRRFGLLNAACCETCCGEEVSMVQSHILFEIRRAGNPSIQQVADELGIDITTFSRQAKALDEKGLIKRQTSSEDKRVSLMQLTAEGKQVLAQIDKYMSERIEKIFLQMTPFEQNVVVKAVGLLNEAVEKAGGCCAVEKKKVACCNQK